ncbi:MAG: PD-(D/E)XK nuclease family protein [Actinomycetaceae bacterium]|nr:PD-(D/E)XK nuclease family protein [Actinomycetaceae bacterium]MDY6082391.1 PD-(D/E)XK nuclease family protein [Actinomycetaceae bacterium]
MSESSTSFPSRDPSQTAVIEAVKRTSLTPGTRIRLSVIGGPGTGKTSVAEACVAYLSRNTHARVAYLVQDRRAASAAHNRVAAVSGFMSESVTVSTVASFAYAIVQAYAQAMGRRPPELINGPDVDVRLAEILAEPAVQRVFFHGEQRSEKRNESVFSPDVLSSPSFRAQLREFLMRCQELGYSPAALTKLSVTAEEPTWAALAAVLDAYQYRGTLDSVFQGVASAPDRLDQAQLLGSAATMFRLWGAGGTPGQEADADQDHEAFRAFQFPRPHWDWIIVDDLHNASYSIVPLLSSLADAGASVVTFGDPDSAVQVFRGGVPYLPDLVTRAVNSGGLGCQPMALATRYRGSHVADTMLHHAYNYLHVAGTALGRRARTMVNGSASSNTEPVSADTRSADCVQAYSFVSSAEETMGVARLVEYRHHVVGTPWSQIAVITRSRADHPALRNALMRAGIPVRPIVAQEPLIKTPVVRDVIDVIQAARGIFDAGTYPVDQLAYADQPEYAERTDSEETDSEAASDTASRPIADQPRYPDAVWAELSLVLTNHLVSIAPSVLRHAELLVQLWDDAQEPSAQSRAQHSIGQFGAGARDADVEELGAVDRDEDNEHASHRLAPVMLNLLYSPERIQNVIDFFASHSGASASETPLHIPPLEELKRAGTMLSRVRAAIQGSAAQAEDVLWAAWDASGKAEQWRGQALGSGIQADTASRNLDSMIQVFRVAQRLADRQANVTIDELIQHLESQQLPEDTIARAGNYTDAISLLSPSSSQGLSFDDVFIMGLNDGLWPRLHVRDALLHTAKLLDIRLGRVTESGTQNAERHAFSDLIDDELRQLLFSISRARQHLVLTCVEGDEGTPSRFFRALGIDTEDADQAESSPALEGQVTGVRLTPYVAPRMRRGVQEAVVRLRRILQGSADQGLSPRNTAAGVANAVDAQSVLTENSVRAENQQRAASLLNMLAANGVKEANPHMWVDTFTPSAPQLGDPGERVSPSSIDTILECPMRGLLQSWGASSETNHTAADIGTIIHTVAQNVPDGDPDRVNEEFDRAWNAAFPDPDSHPQVYMLYHDAQTMVAKLARWLSDRADRTNGAGDVRVEMPLSVQVPDLDVALRSRLDRVEVDGRHDAHIYDFKTGSHQNTANQALDNSQLQAYQLILDEALRASSAAGDASDDTGGVDHGTVQQSAGRAAGQPARPKRQAHPNRASAARLNGIASVTGADLVYLRTPSDTAKQVGQPRLDREHVERIKQKIRECSMLFGAQTLPARVGSQCRRCEFATMCPAQFAGKRVVS